MVGPSDRQQRGSHHPCTRIPDKQLIAVPSTSGHTTSDTTIAPGVTMCRALLLTLLLFTTTPALGAPPQAITIDSRLAARVRPLSAPAGAPAAFASVLLLPGSNGALGLTREGDIQEQQQSFVIRSAYRFLSSGFNVAILDSDPVFPEPTGFTNQRHTQQNADLLSNAIELVLSEWPTAPVWAVAV